MSARSQLFAFPDAAQFEVQARTPANNAEILAQQRAFQEATTRGYAEGFEQGRTQAISASKEMFEEARQQGFAEGRSQGSVEPAQAAASLRQTLELFGEWKAHLHDQAESFCIDLTLAVVERLVGLSDARADFINRTIRAAIVALDPETPQRICVHSTSVGFVASVFPDLPVRPDDSVPPGGARIEGGRLLVDSNIQEAFEQIKHAVLETRSGRTSRKSLKKSNSQDQRRKDGDEL
jgi:flagellar biosynthesis/type III secretory pathway protein FliH